MVSFPNAKINIGLQILEKRADGYHDIETIFYPIALKDIVEIIDDNAYPTEVSFTQSGNSIEGNPQNNLCIKAYQILKTDFPKLPNIQLHLHKKIPSGAGLGGGSADAAYTLMLINNHFQLGLSKEILSNYALKLGSDCPFFIQNTPCLAKGRGEILEEVKLDLSKFKILLIHPNIHISTADAFSQILPNSLDRFPLKNIHLLPISDWKNHIENDFEKTVFNKFPEIESIKNQLYEMGALYASMSGTGSSVYGIFESTELATLNFPANYFCHWV